MKGLLILFLSLLGLVTFAQCNGARGIHHLGQLLKAQRIKRSSSVKTISENLTAKTVYSPVYIAPQHWLKKANKILKLPGQPNDVNIAQYSGYVTVDPIAGRALFYYFVESENSSTKPLVLWLNGGPGCSSLGNGAMMELGPFRVNKDGKTLRRNLHAWNKVANILFLESPVGVGFSYSNESSQYVSGDKQTAADNYIFLVNWLERFPEYKDRDFFITGESYAGHYIPQLAQLILHNNKITNQTVINLRGMAVGNPSIDQETRLSGIVDFLWYRSLISYQIYEGIVSNCNFTSRDELSDACNDYIDQAGECIENIDPYNIYAPLCNTNSSSTTPTTCGFDPCSHLYTYTYLNTPQVQESLHANTTEIPRPWKLCRDIDWDGAPETVLPTFKELTSSGIRVWLYSGDTDAWVPVTSTQYAINKLGLEVETPWHAWYSQAQVGGYAVGYKNLTFVTIKGGGNFVPSYQPAHALTLLSSFLDGKLPPSTYVNSLMDHA